jgi:hypothetical protein
MQLALENARNAVLELQKYKTPFLRKRSMTVGINQKKLYKNYYASCKFLTLKLKFQVKSSDQLQMLRYVTGCW